MKANMRRTADRLCLELEAETELESIALDIWRIETVEHEDGPLMLVRSLPIQE